MIALLLLNVQTGFVSGDTPVYQASVMLERITDLVRRARAAYAPVIWVRDRDNGDLALSPAPQELVIATPQPDAFKDTPLHSDLHERGIKRLVIAGFQSEIGIDLTARRGAALGYRVIVVRDAHSTLDSDQPARELIGDVNMMLADSVRMRSAEGVTFA